MDIWFLFEQSVYFFLMSALAYGCFLSIKHADLSDREAIEREFCASSVPRPVADRFDPRADPKVAGEMGFLL
jgi:hypothetical protein